jgi:hypothetical protein
MIAHLGLNEIARVGFVGFRGTLTASGAGFRMD